MSRACSPGPEPGTVLPGSQLLQCGRRGARGGGAAAGASPAWPRLSGCSPRPRTRGLQSPGGTGPARRALRATATPWKAWALRPQASRALGRRPAPAAAGAPAQRKAECDRRPSRSAKKSCSLWGLDEGPAGQEGGVRVEQTWAWQGSHTRRGLRKLRKREAAAPSGSSRGGSERPEAERARKWGRARAGPSQRHPDRGKGAWKVLGRTPQPPGGTGSAAPLRPAVAPGDPLAELRPRGGGHAGRPAAGAGASPELWVWPGSGGSEDAAPHRSLGKVQNSDSPQRQAGPPTGGDAGGGGGRVGRCADKSSDGPGCECSRGAARRPRKAGRHEVTSPQSHTSRQRKNTTFKRAKTL